MTVLGTTSVAGTSDQDAAGQAEAFRTTASASAQVSSVAVYVDSSSQASQLNAGLYSDASGHPGSLLAQGSLSHPSGGNWNTVSLSSTATVSKGSTYWIGILGSGGTLVFRDCRRCGDSSEGSKQTGLGSLPGSWSTGSAYRDAPLSAYAIGTLPDPGTSGTTTTAPTTTTTATTPTGSTTTSTTSTTTPTVTTTTSTTTTSSTTTTTVAKDTAPPSVPTGLHATTLGQTSLTLVWNPSTDNIGVAGYNLYNGSMQIGHTAGGTSYGVTGLTCATNYVFWVAATDAAGNISAAASVSTKTAACTPAPSGPDTTPPSTPTKLSVTSVGQSTVALSWTASTDNLGVAGYNVFQGSSKAGSTAGTTYTVSGLACGTTYTLSVQAFDTAGNVSLK
ncbi:MAG: fibronectin type III domain-containing protein, partial [Gaiellaceae bacterium]